MKITLRGKNIEITEAIEEKVSEKLSKLDKYFIVSENVEAKVLVRTYPYGQKIEVTIPTEYVLLRAEVVDQDLYNAIDLVIDKLEGQIRKYKTRLNRKSKDNKLAFNLASIEPLEEEEEDVLVKTKTITPKPMDMEEAIMQMELIGHSFFVYRDTETDAISIVYRRNAGDYGLIERLTGDGKIDDLIAPLWSIKKVTILNDIDKKMKELDVYQGDLYKK